MRSLSLALLLAATMTVGLMAGLLASYAYSVMPALNRTDDHTFVEVMQDINVAIINGWFLVSFVGGLVFTALAAALHARGDPRPALPWIIAGLALYVVTLLITMAGNVPLNNELAAAGPPDHIVDLATVRERFEAAWVRRNVARAVTCTAAFGCLALALAVHTRHA